MDFDPVPFWYFASAAVLMMANGLWLGWLLWGRERRFCAACSAARRPRSVEVPGHVAILRPKKEETNDG